MLVSLFVAGAACDVGVSLVVAGQHLVMLECHLSWQGQHLVMLECLFSWQGNMW